MTIPDLENPAWVAVSAALLAELHTPRTVTWIKYWSRENQTKTGDWLNTIAYLSAKGLITPCYDSNERPHWVTINNVPYGWLTYRTTPEKRPTKKKISKPETVSDESLVTSD